MTTEGAVAITSVCLTLIGALGAGIWFIGKLSAAIERLSCAVDKLEAAIETIDDRTHLLSERVRVLESKDAG